MEHVNWHLFQAAVHLLGKELQATVAVHNSEVSAAFLVQSRLKELYNELESVAYEISADEAKFLKEQEAAAPKPTSTLEVY